MYSAELNAILSCVTHLNHLPPQNYLLLSDSLSSLKSTNPLIQRIQLMILSLLASKSHITFTWISGHINFPQHDAVDAAARHATSLPKITDPIPSTSSNLKSFYRFKIQNLWFQEWNHQTHNKLQQIKPTPQFWSSSTRPNRREKTILSRLRIGHTRLIHSFLLLNLLGPPICSLCPEETLTIDHLFSYPKLEDLRSSFSVPPSTILALSNDSQSVTNTFSYLKATQFFPLL